MKKNKSFLQQIDDEFESEYEVSKQDKTMLKELFKKPPKIKRDERTTYKEVSPNTSLQADVLKLPNDNGYDRALVITDIYTRKTDALPMKDSKSTTVLKASEKIFDNSILDIRRGARIITDGGTEFKGVFKNFYQDKSVTLQQREPGRHLGIVDNKIQKIGDALLKLQAKDELRTGRTSRLWMGRLPKVISILNKSARIQKEPEIEFNKKVNLLPIGTEVRRILYVPRDILDEKRLYGKFRSADQRWSTDTFTITNYIIYPDAPPMYILKDVDEPIHYKHVQKVE
jgi:hypothetical protein